MIATPVNALVQELIEKMLDVVAGTSCSTSAMP